MKDRYQIKIDDMLVVEVNLFPLSFRAALMMIRLSWEVNQSSSVTSAPSLTSIFAMPIRKIKHLRILMVTSWIYNMCFIELMSDHEALNLKVDEFIKKFDDIKWILSILN